MSDERDHVREQVAALISERAQEAALTLSKSVRPLIVPTDSGEPDQFASCVLFSAGAQDFLLTAAHALDYAASKVLYVGGTADMVEVIGERFQTVPESGRRADDRCDLAFVALDSGVKTQLQDCIFLGPSDLNLDERPLSVAPRRSFYLVVGYPVSRSRVHRNKGTLSSGQFTLTTVPSSSDVYKRLDLSEDTHLAVEFHRQQSRNTLGHTTAPKPIGASGGGIWRFDSLVGPADTRDTLVAISIEWHRKRDKVIIGSRMPLVIEAIRHKYPNLSEALPTPRRLQVNIKDRQDP